MRLQLLLLLILPLALSEGIPDGYDFWWTALGDSYASGVGAGTYTDGYRCLRYDGAYPVQMQGNNDLGLGTTPEDKRLFQNCVCSGAEVEDVETYQLLDADTWGVPSLQYGDRPRFGEPQVATLSIGGDDIDFPGILFNCIIETHLPSGGPPFRTCEDQQTYSWGLINDPALVTSISELIGKIVTKGQAGQAGDKFKLYVTGYGQFFNAATTLCNDVTFARTANPKPDGKPHNMMTTTLRTTFNDMSLGLNKAIQAAVALNTGVTYIDIDSALTGHRFCEEGINEPDQTNENLWLFHYPYNEPNPDVEITGTGQAISGPDYTSVLEAANTKVFGTSSISQLSAEYSNARAVDDAFYAAIDWTQAQAIGGINVTGFWDGTVGARAKLFHPQPPFHTWIQNTIVQKWVSDRDIDSTGATSTQPAAPAASTPAPVPPARWSYTFHSYTGNLQTGVFSFFVLPGKYNGSYSKKRSLEQRAEAIDRIPSNPHYRRSLVERTEASTTTEELLDKRTCCGVANPPPPLPTTDGQVFVWTQSGSGATSHGSFALDCTQAQDAWQAYSPSDTGLPYYLEIQSGHACAFDAADDGNLDGLHVKYAAQYLDVPTGINDNVCATHDNGVTCNNFTV